MARGQSRSRNNKGRPMGNKQQRGGPNRGPKNIQPKRGGGRQQPRGRSQKKIGSYFIVSYRINPIYKLFVFH